MKAARFALAAALAAAAGCISSVNTTENADKNMTPTHIADSRFVTDGAKPVSPRRASYVSPSNMPAVTTGPV